MEEKKKDAQLKVQRIMGGKLGFTNMLKGVKKQDLSVVAIKELDEVLKMTLIVDCSLTGEGESVVRNVHTYPGLHRVG